ncbi:F-box domain-containing protein [Mycena chlorophos]|uniref:F-box domain-containing protein n=1 Tax=Mycena chlorophos TaxID=658473 RepID=A0A8H6THF6_MYCCL|nr:F-box domain-containing protein [Mycena chlorophos]
MTTATTPQPQLRCKAKHKHKTTAMKRTTKAPSQPAKSKPSARNSSGTLAPPRKQAYPQQFEANMSGLVEGKAVVTRDGLGEGVDPEGFIPELELEEVWRHALLATVMSQALRVRLSTIDEAINTLRVQLAALEADKAGIEAELTARRYPIHTIHTLPEDVVLQIFEAAVLEDPPDRMLQQRQAQTNDILALAAVSSAWRSLALATPALWRRFAISGYSSDPVLLLDAFLERSGSHLLEFDITPRSPTDLIAALTRLAPHAARWRRAVFVIDDDCSMPPESLPESLPRLEYMDLGYIVFPADGSDTTGLTAIQAPMLRTLVTKDAPSLQSPRFAQVLSNLTRLTLENSGYTPRLALLRLTPKLEVLTIGAQSYGLTPTHGPALVLLPALHRLNCTENNAAYLLHYIRVPALKELHLIDLNDAMVRALEVCIRASQKNNPTLRSIFLAGKHDVAQPQPVRVSHVQALFLLAPPTVAKFTISNLGLLPSQVRGIAGFLARQPSCLTGLAELVIEGCSAEGGVAEWVELAQGKWDHGRGSLKYFSLDIGTRDLKTAMAPLDEMEKEGLNLVRLYQAVALKASYRRPS